MSSDPFNQREQKRTAQPRFGQIEVVYTEKVDKKGKEYFEYVINIFPLDIGKVLAKKEVSFSKGWLKIFQPSLHKMVENGKADSPSDLATGGHWVKYQWGEYKSYDTYDINHNKQNYPEGNKRDEDGTIYASIRSIQILDVYPDEDACLAARNEFYGVGPEHDEVPDGFSQPKVEALTPQQALAFFDGLKTNIKEVIQKARDAHIDNNGVNLDTAKELLAKELPMMANLPFDSEQVKKLMEEIEKEPPF